jgi:hypothetical protein
MPSTRPRTRIRVGAALAVLAVAAPVAAAKPIYGGEPAPTPTPTPAAAAPVEVVVTRDTGFDWTDAAIGGAVAAGLLGITGGGVLIARRPREDTGSALGAH